MNTAWGYMYYSGSLYALLGIYVSTVGSDTTTLSGATIIAYGLRSTSGCSLSVSITTSYNL